MKECAFRTKKKSGELACAVRQGLVINETCDACQGVRPSIKDHPRAKARKRPMEKRERDWLRRLGCKPRAH